MAFNWFHRKRSIEASAACRVARGKSTLSLLVERLEDRLAPASVQFAAASDLAAPIAVIANSSAPSNVDKTIPLTPGAPGNGVAAAITPAPLTITAATNTKVYDGTASTVAIPTITGGRLFSGDTGYFSESFDNKNVGTGKTLSASGGVNDGNVGKNYAITYINDTRGAITPRSLTVTAVTNTKAYDGTTSAAAIPTVTGLIPGDTVTGLSESYNDANPGTGKTLTVSGYTINDGNGGHNYSVILVSNTTGVIQPQTPALHAADDAYAVNMNKTLTVAALPSVSSLTMHGHAGDFFTQSRDYSYSTATGSFTAVSTTSNYVSITYTDNYQSEVSWMLKFASVGQAPLTTGTYTKAMYYPFPGQNNPLLWVFDAKAGTIFSTLTGQFTVNQAIFNASAQITNFDATFIIPNKDGTPALSGEIQYNNVPPSGVLSNDSSDFGYPLHATLVSGPTHGALALHADGTFSYTPANNFSGTDSFTYKANNGISDSNVATVNIIVFATNQAPVAQDQHYAFNDDVPFTVAAPGVLVGASDVDNDQLTAVLISGPSHGTLNLHADGSFLYTPALNFYGTDTFTFQASDGSLTSNRATASLTVTQVDHPPVAQNDAYSVVANQVLSVTPLPGVTSMTVHSQPGDPVGFGQSYYYSLADGSFIAYRNFDNGVSVYFDETPLNDFWSFEFAAPAKATLLPGTYLGATDFPYQAPLTPGMNISGGGRSGTPSTGKFTVTQARYDTRGNVLSFDATFEQHYGGAPPALTGEIKFNAIPPSGVLAHDSDPDGDPLTAKLVSAPAHGTLSLNADGTFIYTPDAGFSGPDSFTYKANDGILDSNLATVNLNVVPGASGAAVSVTSSQANAIYGTALTFTAAVTTSSGTPSGTLEFFDDTTHTDLGAGVLQTGTSTWSYVTAPSQLQVAEEAHAIHALFTGANPAQSNSGLLLKGETILPRPLTVTAATSTKVYDGTTKSATLPTITGTLIGSDTANFTEAYDTSSVGTGKTLTPAGSINDGNGGHDYAATFINDTTGVILPPPLLPLSAAIAVKAGYTSVTEPAPGSTATYWFTIALSRIPRTPVTVWYRTHNGSAQAGLDFASVTNNKVTFPAFSHGATATTPPAMDIGIKIYSDAAASQNPETFDVVLTSALNAVINSGSKSASGIIKQTALSSAGPPTISIADYAQAGPTAGKTIFDVPITLTNVPSAQPITLYYKTANRSATAGIDYQGINGHIVIAAGETTATIPITIYGDAAAFATKAFTLSLTSATGATLGNAVATISITTSSNLATAVSVTTSNANETYGNPITFAATVTAARGTPTGSVEFFDDAMQRDLGAGILQAGTSTWFYVSPGGQLKVGSGNQYFNPHVIRAVFTGPEPYQRSSGLLPGGETILPRALTVLASISTKAFDETTAASSVPTLLP